MSRTKKLLTVEPVAEQSVPAEIIPADADLTDAVIDIDVDVPNEDTVNAIVEARTAKPVKKAKKAGKKVAKKAKKVTKKAVKKTAKKKAKK